MQAPGTLAWLRRTVALRPSLFRSHSDSGTSGHGSPSKLRLTDHPEHGPDGSDSDGSLGRFKREAFARLAQEAPRRSRYGAVAAAALRCHSGAPGWQQGVVQLAGPAAAGRASCVGLCCSGTQGSTLPCRLLWPVAPMQPLGEQPLELTTELARVSRPRWRLPPTPLACRRHRSLSVDMEWSQAGAPLGAAPAFSSLQYGRWAGPPAGPGPGEAGAGAGPGSLADPGSLPLSERSSGQQAAPPSRAPSRQSTVHSRRSSNASLPSLHTYAVSAPDPAVLDIGRLPEQPAAEQSQEPPSLTPEASLECFQAVGFGPALSVELSEAEGGQAPAGGGGGCYAGPGEGEAAGQQGAVAVEEAGAGAEAARHRRVVSISICGVPSVGDLEALPAHHQQQPTASASGFAFLTGEAAGARMGAGWCCSAGREKLLAQNACGRVPMLPCAATTPTPLCGTCRAACLPALQPRSPGLPSSLMKTQRRSMRHRLHLCPHLRN